MRSYAEISEAVRNQTATMRQLVARAAVPISPASVLTGGGQSGPSLDFDGRQRQQDSGDMAKHFIGQVYTSVRPIAQRIAGQPIRLARVAKSVRGRSKRAVEPRQWNAPYLDQFLRKHFGYTLKGNETLEVIDQHPVLDALNRPAPSIPGWFLWHQQYVTVCSLEVTGTAYWWKPVVNGRREIWYFPAHWVRPVIDTKGGLYSGWAIRPPGTTESLEVPLDEIVPFWYPSILDPLKPYGPLEAGIRTVLVDEYVTESQKRQFQQGYKPGLLVRAGSEITLKSGKTKAPHLRRWQYNQLVEQIKSRMMGVIHHGEPLILDAMVSEVTPWDYKPSQMDYGGNMEITQSRVEQLFGTNPYMSGAASLGSRAEAAEAEAQFVNVTVNPKIELLSKGLTVMVLPAFDDSGMYVLFIEPCRPHDSELEAREREIGISKGGLTINEFRAGLGMAPVPWGDAIVVPTNSAVVPVADLGSGYYPPNASPPAGGPPKPVPDPGAPKPDEQGEQIAEGDESPDAASVGSLRVKSYDDLFYSGYCDTWLKLHDTREHSFKSALLPLFAAQGESVIKRLLDHYGSGKGSLRHKATAAAMLDVAIESIDEWASQLLEAATDPLAYALASGATLELKSFGQLTESLPAPPDAAGNQRAADIQFEFGVDIPSDVRNGLRAALNESLDAAYWVTIAETTKADLHRTISDGLEAGNTLRQITASIKDDVFGGDVAENRAENIARTEVTGALNAGAQAAREHLAADDIVNGKEWFATYDGRTRPAHSAANGQERPVAKMFVVGGEDCMYPGDRRLSAKNRCRCRCVASSITAFSRRNGPIVVGGLSFGGCEIHG